MRAYLLKGVFLGFSIWLSLAVGGQPILAAEAPAAVRQAAEKGLPTILESLPDELVPEFNFSGPEELSQASLGEPFQIFTIHPDKILNYDGVTPIEEMISGKDQWLFPITVNGESRLLLKVVWTGERWKTSSIGSAGLAQEWAGIVAQYPKSASYTHKLVRIYQATADFVLLGGTGGDMLVPLEAGRVALGMRSADRVGAEPRDPADIIFGLQGPIAQNIEAYQ